MRVVDPKKMNIQAKRAATRGRRFALRSLAVVIGLVALIIVAGYALFYSGWLDIRDISINGLNAEHSAEVRTVIESQLNHSIASVPVGKNIVFFRNSSMSNLLESSLGFLEGISIKKDFAHGLIIQATERIPKGIWCFNPSAVVCRYFDEHGAMWGNPGRSLGYLLLSVDDLGHSELQGIDPKFLEAIKIIVSGLAVQNIKIKNITIPEGSFTEFNALIEDGYLLKFSTDSNIAEQLNVYRIFRDQKITPGLIHPKYLDLRYDSRVYYK